MTISLRLLIRQRIQYRIAKLRVGARRDGMQITHRELGGYGLAAAFEIQRDLAAHTAVDHIVQRLKLGHILAVDLDEVVDGIPCSGDADLAATADGAKHGLPGFASNA